MSQELKEKCDKAAKLIWEARKLLETVEVTDDIDKRALRDILTDLTWANENSTVIGAHLIGQKLDDTMGYTRR